MKFRYRIMNKHGQVLCHVDNAQQAGDVIINTGNCENFYSEDLKGPTAFPFTTWKQEYSNFVGTQHRTTSEFLKG